MKMKVAEEDCIPLAFSRSNCGSNSLENTENERKLRKVRIN
jgi:hypothetical protein